MHVSIELVQIVGLLLNEVHNGYGAVLEFEAVGFEVGVAVGLGVAVGFGVGVAVGFGVGVAVGVGVADGNTSGA